MWVPVSAGSVAARPVPAPAVGAAPEDDVVSVLLRIEALLGQQFSLDSDDVVQADDDDAPDWEARRARQAHSWHAQLATAQIDHRAVTCRAASAVWRCASSTARERLLLLEAYGLAERVPSDGTAHWWSLGDVPADDTSVDDT